MDGDCSPPLFITADGLHGDSKERGEPFLCPPEVLSDSSKLIFFHKYYSVTFAVGFRKLSVEEVRIFLKKMSEGNKRDIQFD